MAEQDQGQLGDTPNSRPVTGTVSMTDYFLDAVWADAEEPDAATLARGAVSLVRHLSEAGWTTEQSNAWLSTMRELVGSAKAFRAWIASDPEIPVVAADDEEWHSAHSHTRAVDSVRRYREGIRLGPVRRAAWLTATRLHRRNEEGRHRPLGLARRSLPGSRRTSKPQRATRVAPKRGDPHPSEPEPDDDLSRLRAVGREAGVTHISEPLEELLAELLRRCGP